MNYSFVNSMLSAVCVLVTDLSTNVGALSRYDIRVIIFVRHGPDILWQ